jgi:hypothetical protein
LIIVDTTVWVDYLRGVDTPEAQWLELRLESERMGLTDLILCEVLQGTRSPGDFRAVQSELLRFEVFETGGIPVAIAAARNTRRLRSEGITVRRTIDCLIATFCLQGGHALLHRDRDFDPFERYLGLAVVRA